MKAHGKESKLVVDTQDTATYYRLINRAMAHNIKDDKMTSEISEIISEIMFDEALKLVAKAYAKELDSLGYTTLAEVEDQVQANWPFLVRAAGQVVDAGTMIIANKLRPARIAP